MIKPTLRLMLALTIAAPAIAMATSDPVSTATETSSAAPGWNTSSWSETATDTASQVGGAVLPSIAAGSGQYSGAVTELGNALLGLLGGESQPTSTPSINPDTGTMSGVTSITGESCAEASQDYASAYQMEPVSTN